MGSVGVLLIAMGHENYIKMAVNLAASLKAQHAVSIHLVHDGGFSQLSAQEQAVFDSESIPGDSVWHTKDSVDYIKAKTRMYDLSPYDRTLYLDVDMIWLLERNVLKLFDELKGIPFTVMNEGPKEECYWAEPEELRAYTKSEVPLHIFYNEIIYFEKGPEIKRFFTQVKKNFDNPKVSCKKFAGSAMPDELAFIMASLQTGIIPHKPNWLPIYWYLRDKKYRHMQPFQLPDHIYGYSIGGNVTPEYAKAHYNNIVSHFSKVMGIKRPYQVRDKRSFISERTKY